ncbi:MAG: hypothetical protein J5863_06125 [Desulfovibrio sp.]|nr:hypothetical protein [Desulfovibrio sp.]
MRPSERISGIQAAASPSVSIAKATFPAPFAPGLEYNPPARGPWNIVHTGLLLPETRLVYICARGCLRGVVMTAAEMGALGRMSWVGVSESDICLGKLEDSLVEGVSGILRDIGALPRAVLLYPSCVHLFAGFDYACAVERLAREFPSVRFVDCIMAPTMRKTRSEDELTRLALYRALDRPARLDRLGVNIVGNDRPTDPASGLVQTVLASGRQLRDITLCRSFDEYLQMAASGIGISTQPAADMALRDMAERLGTKPLFLHAGFSGPRIKAQIQELAEALETAAPDTAPAEEAAHLALRRARKALGGAPLAVDYTAVPLPLSLARMLLECGFNVRAVYADAFFAEEEDDFRWLQANAPDLAVCSCLAPRLRFRQARLRQREAYAAGREPVLAIGQKAAFLAETGHFVNMVAGGGFWGFSGMARLADLVSEAWAHPKDAEPLIQRKGLGLRSCL